MRSVYLLSVWLHILATAVWLGGMVFLALIIVPVTRKLEDRRLASALMSQAGTRFRVVGWTCLGVLLVTGILNLTSHGFALRDIWSGQVFAGGFGHLLGVKLSIILVMVALSVSHDFFIGPRASAVGQSAPGSPEALRLRRQASWIGRLTLLLVLIVVALGVMLGRG